MTRAHFRIHPDHIWGFALGLALVGMALDYGSRSTPSAPPVTARPSPPSSPRPALPPAHTLTMFPGP